MKRKDRFGDNPIPSQKKRKIAEKQYTDEECLVEWEKIYELQLKKPVDPFIQSTDYKNGVHIIDKIYSTIFLIADLESFQFLWIQKVLSVSCALIFGLQVFLKNREKIYKHTGLPYVPKGKKIYCIWGNRRDGKTTALSFALFAIGLHCMENADTFGITTGGLLIGLWGITIGTGTNVISILWSIISSKKALMDKLEVVEKKSREIRTKDYIFKKTVEYFEIKKRGTHHKTLYRAVSGKTESSSGHKFLFHYRDEFSKGTEKNFEDTQKPMFSEKGIYGAFTGTRNVCTHWSSKYLNDKNRILFNDVTSKGCMLCFKTARTIEELLNCPHQKTQGSNDIYIDIPWKDDDVIEGSLAHRGGDVGRNYFGVIDGDAGPLFRQTEISKFVGTIYNQLHKTDLKAIIFDPSAGGDSENGIVQFDCVGNLKTVIIFFVGGKLNNMGEIKLR